MSMRAQRSAEDPDPSLVTTLRGESGARSAVQSVPTRSVGTSQAKRKTLTLPFPTGRGVRKSDRSNKEK